MIQVKLMGELGKLFGTDWTSADKDLRSAIKLIECQSPGFKEKLQEYVEKGIGIEILHGNDLLIKCKEDIPKVVLPVLKDTVFITPVAAGSGRKTRGFLKLVAGIILYIVAGPAATSVAGTTTTGSQVLLLTLEASAALLAYAGITEFLALDQPGEPEDSYLFGNAAENIKQGAPVPLAYGEVIIPGIPINVAFLPDKLASKLFYSGALANGAAAAGAAGDKSDRVIEGATAVSAEIT